MSYRDIFPFTPRPKQEEFIEDMIHGLRSGPITTLVAPNGFGKTVCILTAIAAMNEIDKVYYSTRTHKQIENVINTIKTINSINGRKVLTGIELSGRDRTCVHPNITNMKMTHDDVMIGCSSFKKDDFCINGDDESKWLHVLKEEDVNDTFAKSVVLGDKEIVSLGRKFNLCPYYLSRAIFKDFNVIACSYNHIFDPSVRYSLGMPLNNSIVICDEAHNIINSMEAFITKKLTTGMIESAMSMPVKFSSDSIYILQRLNKVLSTAAAYLGKEFEFMRLGQFKDMLESHGISEKWIGRAIAILKRDDKDNGFLDTVISFLYFLKGDDEDKEVFMQTRGSKRNKQYELKVSTMNIEPIIDDIIEKGAKLLFVSGTLSSGFFEKRFEKNMNMMDYTLGKRKLAVYITDVIEQSRKKLSSYFKVREDEDLLGGFGYHLEQVLDHIDGGGIAFFPSYDFMYKVYRAWEINGCLSYNSRGMFFKTKNGDEIPAFMEKRGQSRKSIREYKEEIRKGNKALLMSVFRGSASEGEDFPGKYCRAVFCMGVPLKNVKSREIEYKIRYYNKLSAGLGLFWIRWDAMVAVNQAIGRGIRDPENDKAIAILMDTRYNKSDYSSFLVKWVRDCIRMKGRDATPDAIGKDVERFFSR